MRFSFFTLLLVSHVALAAPHHRRSLPPHRPNALSSQQKPLQAKAAYLTSSLRPGVRAGTRAVEAPRGRFMVQPRHIVLEERGHQRDDGRDQNGYDDGSWRGDAHDYGGGPQEGDEREEDGRRGDDDWYTEKDVWRGSKKNGTESSITPSPSGSTSASAPTANETAQSFAAQPPANAPAASRDETPPASGGWTTSNAADCQALDTFYTSLSGSRWVNNSGWASVDGACCAWLGVGCNMDGRVTSLKLPSNGLTGAIPAATYLLDRLVTLDLSGNSLTGPIPDQFGALPQLAYLFIDSNALTGTLPPSLVYSMALNVVHLGNNTLSGLLSFPSATNLTQLFAARNAFTSFGLPQNSTTITRIAIDQNPIAGPLPSAASLPALEQFSASKCNLTGSVFDLGQLPRLKKLDLRNNQLTGDFPAISSAPQLEVIALSGNTFTGSFPTGTSPATLTTCQLDAITKSSCPPLELLNDPMSLAARCQLRCRGGGPDLTAVEANARSLRTISRARRRWRGGKWVRMGSASLVILYALL